MKRSPRRARPALVLLAPALGLAAVTAGAQQPTAQPAGAQNQAAAGASCEIDQNKPGSLGLAVLSITRAQALPDTAVKNKALRDAVKRVNDDQKAPKDNPVGTAFTLAQAYTLLAQDLHTATAGTRADLGLTANATAPARLLPIVDSLLTVVEQAKPGCRSQTAELREYAWAPTANAALQALNAQKADSAIALANTAVVVNPKNALTYYVLAAAASQKGDNATAAQNWPRVAELTASDTSAQGKELRSSALFNVAAGAAQAAEAAPAGEAQKAAAQKAATAIRAYLDAFPTSPDATRLQASLARVVTLTGDSAAVSGVYAQMLQDPSRYDDLALTNAGVIAVQANKNADAARLFEAALQKNPNSRDALNNLAATDLQLKRYDAIPPIAQRLIAVDPANPDNYLFLAFAYQGLAKAATGAAQRKTYNDSLTKYAGLADKQPVKVTFTEFTRGESRAILGMTVASTEKAGAKGAAAAPKSYAFTVEFLDKSGAVIDTQQVSVGPIGAGDSKTARVESPKGGVVAFRYKVAS